MKKWLSLLLCLCMVLSLVACNQTTGNKPAPADGEIVSAEEDADIASKPAEESQESKQELDDDSIQPEEKADTEQQDDPGRHLFENGYETIRYGSVSVKVPASMGEFLDAHKGVDYFMFTYPDEVPANEVVEPVEVDESFTLEPGDSDLLVMSINPTTEEFGWGEDFEVKVYVQNFEDTAQSLRDLTITSIEVNARDSYDIEYRGIRLLEGDPEREEFFNAFDTVEEDWDSTYGGYELYNNKMDYVEFGWSPNVRWTQYIKLEYNYFYHNSGEEVPTVEYFDPVSEPEQEIVPPADAKQLAATGVAPVEDVLIQSDKQGVGVTTTIESGSVKVGDELYLIHNYEVVGTVTCISIEFLNDDLESVEVGDRCLLQISNADESLTQENVLRGDYLIVTTDSVDIGEHVVF